MTKAATPSTAPIAAGDDPGADKRAEIVWSDDGGETKGLSGTELIGALVKRLPNKPGVYRMMNAAGDVLYVGKARSLKKRVTNYAQGKFHTNRIGKMVRETATMEFVVTRTEAEALLLEANLIKRMRPRFNVLLRDDKSFPFIVLTDKHASPGLFKHRGAQNAPGSYFGPFASAGAVNRTINTLQRAFLLRTCTDSVFESRTRPCLLHQIKRCAAPCTGEISSDDYAGLVADTRRFLSGRSKAVQEQLATAMEQASEELDFERAAVYRDRLSALSHVQAHQGVNPVGIEDADVFALHQEGGQACIQVFFFRTGQNWGNHAYFPRADASVGPEELLGAFLTQFYDDRPTPALILLSGAAEGADLIAEAFSTRAGRRTEIAVPQRGAKRDVINAALQNAREALGRRMAETSSQARLMAGLRDVLGIGYPLRRIEIYDNSHIMGTNAVGGMVVAGATGFAKNQYRKFNIKWDETKPGDDFAMMREVLTRRFSRLVKDEGLPDRDTDRAEDERGDIPAWPDLLLIDGGAGQLSAVRTVLEELGVADAVALVGVAKGVDRDAGRERIFMQGRDPFTLPPRDPVLYFIQRLRDEAHRFAIGTHRAKRKKDLVANPLDEIEGIGPTRKRALLQHFGTAKAVSRAGLEDLAKVEGVSKAMAQAIHDHFR